jgi:hypothetical protein
VNLSDFYSYKLIRKLTVSLKLQEFSFSNITVSVPLPLESAGSEELYLRLSYTVWRTLTDYARLGCDKRCTCVHV